MDLLRTDEWLVGFLPSPNRWCYRLLGGRTHVYAMRRVKPWPMWLMVEQSVYGMAVWTWGQDRADAMIDHTLAQGRLFLVPRRARELSFIAPPLQTCVSVVKALIGLQAHFVVTPNQLMKRLPALGAIELGGNHELLRRRPEPRGDRGREAARHAAREGGAPG